MPILREQTKNYLDKFRDKTGFYNLILNPVKATTPPQGGGELPISCSGAPNVASVWINYNYNSELPPRMVLEIDNYKYTSADGNMPTHLFGEKYPHIQVIASSGGEYYFSNTSPTLCHRISMYELNYNAEVGGYSGDNETIQLSNNNTVISFYLGERKGI